MTSQKIPRGTPTGNDNQYHTKYRVAFAPAHAAAALRLLSHQPEATVESKE